MTEAKQDSLPTSLDALQELVGYQLRAGAFGAAVVVLQAYTKAHPEERWPHPELCRCLLRLERHDEATACLTQLRERFPSAPEVLALEGLQHQIRGDAGAARSAYEAALAQDDSLLWAAYNLARLAAEAEDDGLCEQWLDHVIARQPEHFPARLQRALLYGRTQRGEQAHAELVETINANPLMLQPILLLAELRLRDGYVDEAVKVLTHGLQANPLAHPLREALARVFATHNDPEAAFGVRLELCRLRGTPGDFLDLGNAALLMGSNEHAVVAFTKAINEAPKDWRGHFNLAELHRAHGDYHGALPLYQKALACEPCDRVLVGLALWHLEADEPNADPTKALAYLEQALALSPEMPEALYNIVLAHSRLEQPEQATAAYATLTQRLPPGHPLRDELPALQDAISASVPPMAPPP